MGRGVGRRILARRAPDPAANPRRAGPPPLQGGRVQLRPRGSAGALLGDDVVYAEAGDLAFKPRDQWHTFWNAGGSICRILEIISPAGFEHYFDDFAEAPESRRELGARYGLEVDLDSVAALCEEHGLRFPRPTDGRGPSG